MSLKIALAGNPNCGKTTLFNYLTGSNQYVGNWPGVTVEKKEGKSKFHNDVIFTDLPGIYSLSPYTLEEVVARNYLINERPDAILNIVDGTNLERNLYLTTQLIEIGIPVVIAINMMDIVHDMPAEQQRWYAIKIFERDKKALETMKISKNVLEHIESDITCAEAELDDDSESIITNERYNYITDILKDCYFKKHIGMTTSDKIDRFVTNKILALPIFVVIMFLVYYLSVSSVGAWLGNFVSKGIFGKGFYVFGNVVAGIPTLVKVGLEMVGCADWLQSLIIDGIIGGVGSVLGFVPQILVLFLFLAFLEACGYMSRIAFVLDKIFRKFGLSGKSFIPILIGTGCGVPGIMASRTIENLRDRRMTIITTTFIPCGAKMPIIALIASALFGGAWWVAPSAYFIGIISIVVSGIILKKTKPFLGDAAPFVMELPAYHMPTASNVLRAMWERGWSFIKKAGTIILLSSVLLWFLQNFGFENGSFTMVSSEAGSILATIGNLVAWIFAPLGFGNWQSAVATITGLLAKENIVSTFGVISELFNPLSAYSFMIFNLLCAPCVAAMGAIKSEMKSAKWTLFAVGYQTGFAYSISLIVYQVGLIFTGVINPVGITVSLILAAFLLYMLFRPQKQYS